MNAEVNVRPSVRKQRDSKGTVYYCITIGHVSIDVFSPKHIFVLGAIPKEGVANEGSKCAVSLESVW